MNFALVNLGCKVNHVESDAFASALLAQGNMLSSEEKADIILVNTCTVTGEAEKKTRKAVRHALRVNDHASVIVTGCAAVINPTFYESLDLRVCVRKKDELLAEIKRSMSKPERLDEINARAGNEHFRTRVGVKIQDGCNNACTYCIVHVARGKAQSRPFDEVVQECVSLALAGVREIVLTGINLGSYRDSVKGCFSTRSLADLLTCLLNETKAIHNKQEPAVRFRLSSIEPCDVDEALIDVLSHAEGRICRHLHLPMQSGSSKVLREMARPYDARYYLKLVCYLRARMDSLSLSTDIIVGFPGETEEDFQETLDVARRCRFSKIHVFPYSRREGTPAASRSDQIPPAVKTARADTLRSLGQKLREADSATRQGKTELALVEENGLAMTESYYELPAPPQASFGSLIPIVFESACVYEHGTR